MEINGFVFIASILFASYGSVAHYSSKLQEGQPFAPQMAFKNLVISVFAAILAFLLCVKLGVGSIETIISSGIAGFLGDRFVNLLANKFSKKIEDIGN